MLRHKFFKENIFQIQTACCGKVQTRSSFFKVMQSKTDVGGSFTHKPKLVYFYCSRLELTMFGNKLRSWMEAVRSKKKQTKKDKQLKTTSTNGTIKNASLAASGFHGKNGDVIFYLYV